MRQHPAAIAASALVLNSDLVIFGLRVAASGASKTAHRERTIDPPVGPFGTTKSPSVVLVRAFACVKSRSSLFVPNYLFQPQDKPANCLGSIERWICSRPV